MGLVIGSNFLRFQRQVSRSDDSLESRFLTLGYESDTKGESLPLRSVVDRIVCNLALEIFAGEIWMDRFMRRHAAAGPGPAWSEVNCRQLVHDGCVISLQPSAWMSKSKVSRQPDVNPGAPMDS